MTLREFLSLLALMIGVAGVWMVSKAIYASPRDILNTTWHYDNWVFPTNEIIKSISKPKADAGISLITVPLAFIIQFFSIILVNAKTPFVNSKLLAALLATAIAITFGALVLSPIHKYTYKKTVEEIKCLAMTDYIKGKFGLIEELNQQPSRPTELKVQFETLESQMKEHFGITRGSSELQSNFVKRVAQKIRYELPKDIALSRLDLKQD